jgi:hypothetical protein
MRWNEHTDREIVLEKRPDDHGKIIKRDLIAQAVL